MTDQPLRLSSAAGRGVVVAAVLGSGLAFLDATVVNVALPHIGSELHAPLAGLQWTVNAYTLTLAALVLLGGSLGDRYGRRRIFVIGVVWFTLASMLCGFAGNLELLISARALQGVGSALLTPGSLAIIQASLHHDDRARAIGLWSGLGGVAAAIGPFIGGWLIDALSWRWIFYINAPLAVAMLIITAKYVPESRDESAQPHRFDIPGAVLGAVGLAGVTYALVEAPGQGASPAVLLTALVGLAGLAAFVVVERRSKDPMMPPELFASRQFSAINVVTLWVYAALSGLFFFLVTGLQIVAGFSALAAGTAGLPITVLMLLFSSRSGAVAQRIGPRIPLIAGPAICALAMVPLLRVGADTSYFIDVLPPLILLGIGLTITVAPLTSAVLAAVPDRHAGVASGVNNAVARAAGLLAVAALPLVAGLSGTAYQNPDAFEDGYRMAVVACAVLFALGAVTAVLFVRRGDESLQPEPDARLHLAAAPHEPCVHRRTPAGAPGGASAGQAAS